MLALLFIPHPNTQVIAAPLTDLIDFIYLFIYFITLSRSERSYVFPLAKRIDNNDAQPQPPHGVVLPKGRTFTFARKIQSELCFLTAAVVIH